MSSATVPTGDQSESDVLETRSRVWNDRPLLRDIYGRYFREMVANLGQPTHAGSTGRYGTILEIGGGSGNFKQYFAENHPGDGRLIATDIVPTRHCELAVDAMEMPFADVSLDNILMQDVLHHIPFPLQFFAEAQRTLRKGGRIVMTEPYISPASRVVMKLAHPEVVVPSAPIFGDAGNDPCPLRGEGAFASNQAVPTRLFFKEMPLFERRFPNLKLLQRVRRSLLVYPLSGGFSGPTLIPKFLVPVAWSAEKVLSPLAPLLAFRTLVVLEKT